MPTKIPESQEKHFRILANILIDKLLDDHKKGRLKYVKKQGKLIVKS